LFFSEDNKFFAVRTFDGAFIFFDEFFPIKPTPPTKGFVFIFCSPTVRAGDQCWWWRRIEIRFPTMGTGVSIAGDAASACCAVYK